MELVFLGTTCMVPTKERNHYSIYLEREGEGILFDCGEGTQRQMKIAGVKPTKITKIFISHWHGDHVLGLPGLIQTMGANQYSRKLSIFGPSGTKDKMKHMFNAFVFDNKIDMEIFDIEQGVIFENIDFIVEAYKLEHSVPTYGYRFIERDTLNIDVKKIKKLNIPSGPLLATLKRGQDIVFEGKNYQFQELTTCKKGKILGIISDTGLCDNCYKIGENSDILISEASYASKHQDKAEGYLHLTAKQAGLIANQSNAKKLILTHFSQRYKTTEDIDEDVKDVFANSVCAYDFMKVNF